MSKQYGEMPTEDMHPQLVNALTEIGAGDFRIMGDLVRPDIVRPVMHEVIFFDKDSDELTSQKVLYTASVVRKPKAARDTINRVSNALEQTDTRTNPVKQALTRQAALSHEQPYFLDRILPEINAQSNNTARSIGGLLMVKDAHTNVVGLRCVYNRALMAAEPTWELRDLALEGLLTGKSADGLRTRNQNDLGDVAVLMVAHCLAASVSLKPTLVHAPSLGIKGL